MEVIRNLQLAREEEQREKKRAARRRQRANRAEKKRAEREASVDSNWSRASGVTSVASTDTGRSNDLEDYGDDGVGGEQYENHGGGVAAAGANRPQKGGILHMIDAKNFQKEDVCEDKHPELGERVEGAIFVQGGNYGNLRKQCDVIVHQLHGLKSSHAHVLILNECPTTVVDFLRQDPADVTDECVCMNSKNE